MGHSSVRGLRRLEWGQGDEDGGAGRSGVSCSQMLAGCRRGVLEVDGLTSDEEAMMVGTVVGKDVLLLSLRTLAGASLGDWGGVTRPAGVAVELVVDKADTLDDALDLAGNCSGACKGTVGTGSGIGVVLLTMGATGVGTRCLDVGEGEGGGVGRLRLAEVDSVEPEARLLFLGRRSGVEVVLVIGRVGRGSG